MTPRSAVASLSLLFLLIWGSSASGSWIERGGAVSFEYQTTSWFFDIPLPAGSYWDARSRCSTSPSSLLNNRCNSSSPTLATCCTSCVNGQPASGPSGCVCSPDEGAICLDLSSTNTSGSVSPTKPVRYAVPVWNPTCRPILLVLNSLSGDADLSVDVGNPAFVSVPPSAFVGTPLKQTVRISQSASGDDSLFICLPPAGVTASSDVVNPQWIHVIKPKSAINWFYVNVESLSLLSTYDLHLSVASTPNDFFVPIEQLNNRINVDVDCDQGYSCQTSRNATTSCNLHVTNLYQDSPYAYHALAAGIYTELELNSSSGVTISLPVQIKTDRLSIQTLVSDFSNVTTCSVSISGLVDVSGNQLATSTFDFSEKTSGVDSSLCDSASIETLISVIDNKRQALQSEIQELGTDLSGVALLYGALISNEHWVACDQLVTSFVAKDLSKPLVISFNSTLCESETGTPEWASDPCCNASLAFSRCCAPRELSLTFPSKYELARDEAQGKKSIVSQQCSSAKCSGVVSTRLVEARDQRLRSERTCREQVASAVNDPRVFLDVAAVCTELLTAYARSEVVCSTDSDCYTSCSNSNLCTTPSNSSNNFAALQDCLLDQMAPSVRAVFLAGRTPDQAMSSYFTVSCNQGSRLVYDSTLDTQAKCEAASACNSDPNLSQQECQDLAADLPNMCATCTGNLCEEFSRFPGCEVFPPVQSRDECLSLQGTHWRDNSCFIDGITTASACLALANQFSTDCSQQYAGAKACPASCVLSSLFTTKSTCQCNPVGAPPGIPPIVLNWCDSFVWNERMQGVSNTGACTVDTEDLDLCFQINAAVSSVAAINRGSVWRGTGFLSSQAQCLGTGQPDPKICSLACSNCSSPSCGVCSDVNVNGFCMFPFNLISTDDGLVLGCEAHQSVRYPDGCMNPNVEPTTCLSRGGEWRQGSLTIDECLGRRACFQPGAYRFDDRSPATFTAKSTADCEACQSSSTSVNTWRQGALLDRTNFQWLPRQWMSGVFSWEQTFSKNQFNQDYETARSNFLYLAFQSTLSCLTGQDESAFAQIACDCGQSSSGNSQCYGSSLSFTAISTKICGLFQTAITVPARVSVEVDQDTQFRIGCISLTVDIVDAETFSRSSASVVSSAFVQSLQLKKLSVVENSDGVVIGQLASDGYQIVFGAVGDISEKDVDVIAGEFRVCVGLKSGSRQPGWKHLGVARASATASGEFAGSNFKLWKNSTVLAPQTDGGPYCFTVDRTGVYALANYLPDAGSATFFDTLTADQQAALIIVIIVYFFLWIFISIALINFGLWWIIQRTAVKFSVDTLKATINFSLLWLASVIRWIYFLVVIVGAGQDMPKPVEIFMVELPLFFFFTVLTVIILKWLEVTRKSGGKMKKPSLFSLSNAVAVVLNLIMYGLLIIFVILASVGVAEEDAGKCSTGTTSENPALSITYHVLVAVICFGLGASFIVIGTKVTIQLMRLGGATSQKVKFIQFTSVAGACSVAMVLQAILLVVTTAVVVPSIVAIIILIIVEVVPIVLLIWTWNKPIALVKIVSSVASLGSSSRSATTSSETGGASSSGGGASSSDASGDTSSTASGSGGGLARLWSLGTDSLDVVSVTEEE